jgi:hypothetical protein
VLGYTTPSRRLWSALRELDRYLSSQSAWLVNDAERHRAGLRVGSSLTGAMANFLVNRRMNKAQRMRWFRRGAVFNGKLGSRLGQLFHAEADPIPDLAMDA